MAPPWAEDGDGDNGEGEGDDNEYNPSAIRQLSLKGGQLLLQEEIYKDSSLVEVPDRIVGIAPTHYANIAKDNSQNKDDIAS